MKSNAYLTQGNLNNSRWTKYLNMKKSHPKSLLEHLLKSHNSIDSG